MIVAANTGPVLLAWYWPSAVDRILVLVLLICLYGSALVYEPFGLAQSAGKRSITSESKVSTVLPTGPVPLVQFC